MKRLRARLRVFLSALPTLPTLFVVLAGVVLQLTPHAPLFAQLRVDAWRAVAPPAGSARQITIGGKGVAGAIDAAGAAHRRDAVSGAWQQIGTGMSRLAIDPAGNFWAIDTQGNLQRPCRRW